jgi:hypothetical protein
MCSLSGQIGLYDLKSYIMQLHISLSGLHEKLGLVIQSAEIVKKELLKEIQLNY